MFVREELVLTPLSPAQLDAACRGPRLDKAEVFGPAERWLKAQREVLLQQTEGMAEVYVLVNAADLTYALGKDLKACWQTYRSKFNVPERLPQEGFAMLGVQLRPIAASSPA